MWLLRCHARNLPKVFDDWIKESVILKGSEFFEEGEVEFDPHYICPTIVRLHLLEASYDTEKQRKPRVDDCSLKKSFGTLRAENRIAMGIGLRRKCNHRNPFVRLFDFLPILRSANYTVSHCQRCGKLVWESTLQSS